MQDSSYKKTIKSTGNTLLAIYLLIVLSGSIFPIIDTIKPHFISSSADFPCADHQCGCDSLEKCQENCCCFPKVEVKTCCPIDIANNKAENVKKQVSFYERVKCQGELIEDMIMTQLLPIEYKEVSIHKCNRTKPLSESDTYTPYLKNKENIYISPPKGIPKYIS